MRHGRHHCSAVRAGRASAGRALAIACAAALATAAGCQEKPVKPKRADHEAAHRARYHPAVNRADDFAPPITGTPASQPVASTEPAWTPGGPGPVGTPILFVNGDSLTVQEVLEPIVDDIGRQAAVRRGADYRDYLFRKVGDEIRNQTSLLVVYQQAHRDFPEDAQDLLDDKADEMIRSVINHRFGGVHARYEQHLKSLHFTLDDMKERARRQIMVTQFLRDRFLPRLREPPRRDLLKYYQTHPDEFTTPPKAELFLIEVPIAAELDKPVDQATPAETTAARQRAREQLDRAREELASGVDFAAVARRYSKGVRQSAGGAWGEISPGTLTRRWARPAEVLFTLESDQVSDVIETDESIFIVKCGRRTEGHQSSFEEAQAEIIARVKEEQYNRLTSRYINRLLEQATIDSQQQQAFFLAVAAAAPQPAAPPSQELAQDDQPVQ